MSTLSTRLDILSKYWVSFAWSTNTLCDKLQRFKLRPKRHWNSQLCWLIWSNIYIKCWDIFYNYTLSLTKHFKKYDHWLNTIVEMGGSYKEIQTLTSWSHIDVKATVYSARVTSFTKFFTSSSNSEVIIPRLCNSLSILAMKLFLSWHFWVRQASLACVA